MAGYVLNETAVLAPPPKLPSAVALAGKFVCLQPMREVLVGEEGVGCFAELFACSHGGREGAVWAFLPYGPFVDAVDMRACYAAMGREGDPLFFVVRNAKSGAAEGVVSFLRMTPAAFGVEIGHIWHAPARQRGRANTESVYLLMRYAFSLGYRRVEWKCNALNGRSRRAALRLGFAFEGVFRQHAVFKGRNRDTAWFALLDGDWEAVRVNIEAWLRAAPGTCRLAELNRPWVAWSLPAHEAWAV